MKYFVSEYKLLEIPSNPMSLLLFNQYNPELSIDPIASKREYSLQKNKVLKKPYIINNQVIF